ncbi:hypothetical protein BGZ52_007664 [Haplosporangium bisporale]|nr:hypothetical protein BGZ52_007664 [Haplosporangium bisporale]
MLKRDRSAPLYGYLLAHKDNKHGDVVRHFGLGLVESAVRYRWTDGSMDQSLKTQIRMHVISLASEGTLSILEEQMFIKEKVARLYVEVAKRQWPGEWDDMDLFLKQMFFKDETRREMALLILRSLCEDICIYDDAVAGLRKKDLRAGLLVIMASELVLKEHYPEGVKGHQNEVTLMVGEAGNDGWTSRLSTLLTELLPRCQSEDPNVHSFVPPLLELYSGYLAKDFENRRQNDAVYRHFASIDFDSVSEFRAKAAQTFQKAVDVIHLGVPVVPLDAFMWVANKVAEALKTQFPVQVAKDSSAFQAFDGALTLMEVTVSSLKDLINDKSHPQSPQVLGAMNTLLGMLIEYNVNCPVVLDRVVGSLCAFTDMFRLNSTLLFQSLDKLFKTVEYPKANGPENEIKELRRRAANTLVKIGRAIPNTLFPIYGEVESVVQRLIQQNLIWPGEKRALLTFLLVIGFNAEMAHDKKAIFEKVVLPVLNDFQSANLQEALSGPKNFMAFIGAMELSAAASKSLQPQEIEQLQSTIMQRRTQLSWSIETLVSFMKETTSGKDPLKLQLWSSCLGSMLPNLLSTVRCLNAILDSSLWQDLSPDMTSLFSLTAEEKEMLVTGKYPSSAPGPVTVTKLISDLKIWMSIVRDNAYKFLAQVTTLGPMFYSIPSLQVMLEQSLFEHMDLLSNRQIRFLINSAVQPLVLNTPPEFMDSVLSHFLGVLISYLDQRLIKDWQLAADEGLVMDEKEEQEELDVSDEIALNDPYHQEGQDRLILLITEVYVEVRVFDQAPKVAFQQIPGIDISQLDAFEAQLSAFANKSKKNAIVAKSEWFKQREQGNKPTSSRTIAGTYEKPSQSVLDSAQDEDIGEGLANLFDE